MPARNTFGRCGECRHMIGVLCRNPAAPYGGKPRLPYMGCFAFVARQPAAPQHVGQTVTDSWGEGYQLSVRAGCDGDDRVGKAG